MMMTKGTDTRSAILDEALAMASRLGLDGVTLGELAKELGLSKSGLFAHFESKEDLQKQVVDLAAERFIELVVVPSIRQPRGEPRVRALFENWLRWTRAPFVPGGCVFVSMANELDDRPGPLRDCLVKYQRDWIGALARAAQIAVDEGHFRSHLDVEQFAHDMYGIALVYHYFTRLLKDPSSEERARRSFEVLIENSRA
jgi:AcrR family transcriptional regulator